MKKKGFTLIELLAVIVILAIIALIATPLVLKYIETARTNSKIISTQNYMKAVENALANYSITNKGKNYPSGCHEISTLNTDLDISVKGDIPEKGTICIEDNKIKTANVEYDDNKNYKYENGKVAVLTGEPNDTVIDYIIDVDVEFVYDVDQSAYVATLPITSAIVDKFEEPMDYDFIIDDAKVETISGAFYESDFILYSYFDDISKVKSVVISDESIMFMSFEELTGNHNVKIGNPRPVKERTFFTANEFGVTITGYDLVLGNAELVISDEDGNKYYNDSIELEDSGYGIVLAHYGCVGNLPEIPEVYTALTNGKTITIKITQTIEGKEVVSTVSRKLDMMTLFEDGYFSTIHMLPLVFYGGC